MKEKCGDQSVKFLIHLEHWFGVSSKKVIMQHTKDKRVKVKLRTGQKISVKYLKSIEGCKACLNIWKQEVERGERKGCSRVCHFHAQRETKMWEMEQISCLRILLLSICSSQLWSWIPISTYAWPQHQQLQLQVNQPVPPSCSPVSGQLTIILYIISQSTSLPSPCNETTALLSPDSRLLLPVREQKDFLHLHQASYQSWCDNHLSYDWGCRYRQFNLGPTTMNPQSSGQKFVKYQLAFYKGFHLTESDLRRLNVLKTGAG